MINCTWNDLETKIALSYLDPPLQDQVKSSAWHQQLRERFYEQNSANPGKERETLRD